MSLVATRVPLANTTNSSRCKMNITTRSATPSLAFPAKLASRKSPPTCTVSLESASCNNHHIDTLICSPPSFSISNMVPFPSSSPVAEEPMTISQPDPTSLMVLDTPPRTRKHSASRSVSSSAAQERRRRVTSRLLRPPQLSEPKGCVDCKAQPPRKRPRLQKKSSSSPSTPSSSKRASHLSHSDLRFLAVVQRDIASRVKELRDGFPHPPYSPAPTSISTPLLHSFEAQDTLLASRLRSMLLDSGIKESDVINLDENQMDVDSDEVYDGISFSPPRTSIGPDAFVDGLARRSSSSFPTSPAQSAQPPSSPSLKRSQSSSSSASLEKPAGRENLIPTLLLRRHSRKLARSNERIGASRESPKKRSPLSDVVVLIP